MADVFDRRGAGRPRGAYGDVRQALLSAWAEGPAPVREVAERASVGYAVARYTASRMLSNGDVRVLADTRPCVLALPDACDEVRNAEAAGVMSPERVREELHRLGAAFWGGQQAM